MYVKFHCRITTHSWWAYELFSQPSYVHFLSLSHQLPCVLGPCKSYICLGHKAKIRTRFALMADNYRWAGWLWLTSEWYLSVSCGTTYILFSLPSLHIHLRLTSFHFWHQNVLHKVTQHSNINKTQMTADPAVISARFLYFRTDDGLIS